MEGHSSAKKDTLSMEYRHRSSPQDEPSPPSSLSPRRDWYHLVLGCLVNSRVSLSQNLDLLGRIDGFECILRP